MPDSSMHDELPATASEDRRSAAQNRRHLLSTGLVFAAWFVLILLLKWSTLNQQPVWDEAMGVFPAAVTLAESDFDLGHLLEQPGYSESGPNVHSLSLITWITAGFIAVLGEGSTLFPALHIFHFAIAAMCMTGLYRFAATFLIRPVAAVASMAVLVFPLVLTQAGYMYLEIPLLAVTALAMLAWLRQRPGRVVLWVTVAVLIKGSGLIVAGALAGATLFDPRLRSRRFGWGLATLAIPAAIVALRPLPTGFGASDFREHAVWVVQFLIRVPDLLVLLLAYLVVSILAIRRHGTADSLSGRTDGPDRRIALYAISFLLAAFFLFYLVLPLVGNGLIVVPRYYVQVLPFAVFGLIAMAVHRYRPAVIVAALVVFVAWSAINRNGEFYPDNNINNFPLIERSGAYADLNKLQQAGIRALEALPQGIPVFYDQPAHIKFTYPLLGYADSPPTGGVNIALATRLRDITDFPEEFYLLYEYPWLGGDFIRTIWREAEADPGRTVEIRELRVAQFRSRLIHVTSGTIP